MNNNQSNQQQNIYLSEIFALENTQPNIMGFKLTPKIDRETGNRLSYHFSRQFPEIIVIWFKDRFWVLRSLNKEFPTKDKWKEALENIQEQIEDFRNNHWTFQLIPNLENIPPLVLAKLAYQVFKIDPYSEQTKDEKRSEIVYEKNHVIVKRKVNFWSEEIELKGIIKPVLTLTVRSEILFKNTLANFFENHPDRQNSEKLLIGLKVQIKETNSTATIVSLAGKVGDHREDLMQKATGSISKEALKNAPDNQPLVSVQFKGSKKKFHYAMLALNPIITPETAFKFRVDYGTLLKHTKISLQERQKLLIFYKDKVAKSLEKYGLKLAQKSVNSQQYPQAFFLSPKTPINQTKLLFGNGVEMPPNKVLYGLKQGGVYNYYQDFLPNNHKQKSEIKISVLNLCKRKVQSFFLEVKKRLQEYKFDSNLIDREAFLVDKFVDSHISLEVEKRVNKLIEIQPDIVLVFLPRLDRNNDEKEQGSLYHKTYAQLLNRSIASQFIYEDTLQKTEGNYNYILNQIIPGILAKLGNIPFVLAKPLKIADYCLGLDISRMQKKNVQGSLNACASVRLYGKRGEFINYQLESDFIEGEEIPKRLLEKLLPYEKFGEKMILIYRDGPFRGQEVNNFLARAKAINSKLILVECKKSGIPRLYQVRDQIIDKPPQGLTLKLSEKEAIVVTTDVYSNVGLARPLRLTIHEKGEQVKIEDIVDTTLKLTLLHYGAMQTTRLPMPLYGADKMANLRLKGVYSPQLEGDKQFWL